MGKVRSEPALLEPREEAAICILCQDDRESDDCLVLAAFVQRSSVLSKDRKAQNAKLDDLPDMAIYAGGWPGQSEVVAKCLRKRCWWKELIILLRWFYYVTRIGCKNPVLFLCQFVETFRSNVLFEMCVPTVSSPACWQWECLFDLTVNLFFEVDVSNQLSFTLWSALSSNSPFTRPGIHMSTCSHAMHYQCWKQYFNTVKAKEERRPHRMRRFMSSFSTQKDEYLCPLCRYDRLTTSYSVFYHMPIICCQK